MEVGIYIVRDIGVKSVVNIFRSKLIRFTASHAGRGEISMEILMAKNFRVASRVLVFKPVF